MRVYRFFERVCDRLGPIGLKWLFTTALFVGLGIASYGLARILLVLHGYYLIPAKYPDVAYWVAGGVVAVLGAGGLLELRRTSKKR